MTDEESQIFEQVDRVEKGSSIDLRELLEAAREAGILD